MSSVSAKLETLAETHCVNPLVILEWFLEIMARHGNNPTAEQMALETIQSQLEGGR